MEEPVLKREVEMPDGDAPYARKFCDASIELGDAGMGMPVFRAFQAIRGLPAGAALHVSSSHP